MMSFQRWSYREPTYPPSRPLCSLTPLFCLSFQLSIAVLHGSDCPPGSELGAVLDIGVRRADGKIAEDGKPSLGPVDGNI